MRRTEKLRTRTLGRMCAPGALPLVRGWLFLLKSPHPRIMVDFSIDMPRLYSPGVVNVERPSSAPTLPTMDKLASVSCNKTQSIVKEVRSEVLEANVMLQCSCLHNISPSVRNVR